MSCACFSEKFLEPGLVLEGAAKLRTIIGECLFLPLDFPLLLLGLAIKPAQDMLDALDGAQRILRVEIGLVGFLAPDEQLRLAVLERRCRGSGFRSP